MDRRAFVAGAMALFAVPLAAEAQQAPKSVRVGILEPDKPPGSVSAFRTRVADLGWTIQYESRYAEGRRTCPKSLSGRS
jgi:hypothetical protein